MTVQTDFVGHKDSYTKRIQKTIVGVGRASAGVAGVAGFAMAASILYPAASHLTGLVGSGYSDLSPVLGKIAGAVAYEATSVVALVMSVAAGHQLAYRPIKNHFDKMETYIYN